MVPLAQRDRPGRRIDELSDLVAGPGDVGQRQPHHRVLPHGQRFAAIERLLDTLPRLVHERARRAELAFDPRVLLVERLAARQRARAADAGAHLLRQLVEQPAADAAGPARMTDDGESGDADACTARRRAGVFQ